MLSKLKTNKREWENKQMIKEMSVCFKNYLEFKYSDKLKCGENTQQLLTSIIAIRINVKEYPQPHPAFGWEKDAFDVIVSALPHEGCCAYFTEFFCDSVFLRWMMPITIIYARVCILEKNKKHLVNSIFFCIFAKNIRRGNKRF